MYLYAFVKRLKYRIIPKILRLLYSSKTVIVSQAVMQTSIEDMKSSKNRRKHPWTTSFRTIREMYSDANTTQAELKILHK